MVLAKLQTNRKRKQQIIILLNNRKMTAPANEQ